MDKSIETQEVGVRKELLPKVSKDCACETSDQHKNHGKNILTLNEPLRATITSGNLVAYNNSLIGHILTVIDATGLEREQKKAVKDLIKQSMWKHYDIV